LIIIASFGRCHNTFTSNKVSNSLTSSRLFVYAATRNICTALSKRRSETYTGGSHLSCKNVRKSVISSMTFVGTSVSAAASYRMFAKSSGLSRVSLVETPP
jgi:hypothetical protein